MQLQVDDAQWWSVHTHSRYSATDALPSPADIVARAKQLGYAGLGITDHGNMAASIELYTECQKAGIKPFPGSELYMVVDRNDKKAKRYHLCMVAYTTQGYRNMVKISTDSHRNFYNKPLVDLADLARYHDEGWSEGIALTTGCYGGLVTQTLLSGDEEGAKNYIAAFASWFDTYVEIQNHNMHKEGDSLDEEQIAARLLAMAEELDLPVVLTQDSHYVARSDRDDHEVLKRLVSYGDGSDDAVFSGDGYHLADDGWMRRHHSVEAWEAGVRGLDRLLRSHDLRIDEADVYRYRVPSVSADPLAALSDRCLKELDARGLLQKAKYFDRFEEELEVIKASGMADYMLLVTLVCDFMREQKIFFQTRGSAAGSLICWMLGISNIDPLKWGARFDRFLSKDRTKPPDIDLDVENLRRKEVLDWISQRFSISQICTYSVLGMDEESGKGSLKVKYLAKQRRVLAAAKQDTEGLSWASVTEHDKQAIYKLAAMEPLAGIGVHPCALVLVNSRAELDEMVPLQWVASSQTMVTQYDGPTIESIGLIKLDLLGSKTISVLRICCENMGVGPEALDSIPLTNAKVFQMISRGDTDGFYQMEGYTTQKGCQELRPRRIGEVIDAMALFRPGVMNSGATESYIKRKFGEEELPERHELIARHTKDTRGILLYQDQIITILRDLGMEPDELTRFLKAVKASNKKVDAARKEMNYFMPILRKMCSERGMNASDWAWLQDALKAFAEYSFNIAHATVYGITAYRCAYLAVHFPVQFHAALLNVAAGTDKEPNYLRVTRKREVRIRRADVNASGLSYRVDPRGTSIRKGILSVEGIGGVIAKDIVARQPYASWDDFVTKAIGSKITGVKPFKKDVTPESKLVGAVKHLYKAGAFRDAFGELPLGKEPS